MEFVSHSPQETQNIAAELAANVIASSLTKKAVVIALEGDLGAGKTTFVQGFTKALGVHEAVKSPTFLLIKRYDLPRHEPQTDRYFLYHIDCYRVHSHDELISLEINTILNDPKNIVLIEWAERIAPILPPERMTIRLVHVDEHTRSISITP